jgi:hypothetical protein
MMHLIAPNIRWSAEAVELDDSGTWPEAVRLALEGRAQLLRDYAARQSEIETTTGVKVHLQNRFKEARDDVVRQVQAALIGIDLIGYHASRLHVLEQADIRQSGLALLSRELAERRVRRLVDLGEIAKTLGQQMLSKHKAADKYRAGRLFFFHSRITLRNRLGLSELLGRWGGEAIYTPHNRKSLTGRQIERTGRPSIVVARVPVEMLTLSTLAEAFCSVYRREQGDEVYDGDIERSSWMLEGLPPERIVEIIDFADPRFEELTQSSSWLPLA